MKLTLLLTFLAASIPNAFGEPQLTSWYLKDSGKYCRLYEDTAAQDAGNSVTTWYREDTVQDNGIVSSQAEPTYAGVSQIASSDDWVYIRTTGMPSHIMGPWYQDPDDVVLTPGLPTNQAKVYRFPRIPVIPSEKTTTSPGATGYYINGVAMFDMTDTFSYSNADGQDFPNTGDGVWVREAYHNEGVTFDPALAHQAMTQYHYHAQPPALRFQMGDHVDFDVSTQTYPEKSGLPTTHSPILAWNNDGLPVYGPFGYADPLDANSGLKRMVSGFQLRDITDRTTLADWSARLHNLDNDLDPSVYGPDVNEQFDIGYYIEDYEYLGDVINPDDGELYEQGVDFDLNEQNVRFCVTPEYPGGTWAYFLPVLDDGTPVFPFSCGRQYFGEPQGEEMASYPETVTIAWDGGPNLTEKAESILPATESDDVVITWSTIEGGSYSITASETLDNDWTEIATSTADDNTLSLTDGSAQGEHPKRFYQLERTSLAAFDDAGFDYLDPDAISFTFTFTGDLPPDETPVSGVFIDTVEADIVSYAYDGTTATVAVAFVPTSLTSGQSYNAQLLVSGPPPGMEDITFSSTNVFSYNP